MRCPETSVTFINRIELEVGLFRLGRRSERDAGADCGCHDNRMNKMWWKELWMGWLHIGHRGAESSDRSD